MSLFSVKFPPRATLGAVAGAGIMVALALSIDEAAMARPTREAGIARFNGIWSVLIITESGSCDRAYRYPVRIVNGVVQHANPGDTSVFVAGRVDPRGLVNVGVSRGDQRAHGVGRLSANYGTGRWNSATSGCAGEWTAERRE